jgi:predicted O-methyltransferase YrrM
MKTVYGVRVPNNSERYLKNLPLLHSWDNGASWNSGGFDEDTLGKLAGLIESTKCRRILETGAGNTSITFLLTSPDLLISIAPEEQLLQRIKDYCLENHINITPWNSIENFSQWTLPDMAKSNFRFDFALLDGNHGWPYVFIDLFYSNFMLDVGGLLMIDDINLHSIKEIAKFLLQDSEHFQLVEDFGKALVFMKTKETDFGDWIDQPYINKMSDVYEHTGNPFHIHFPWEEGQ